MVQDGEVGDCLPAETEQTISVKIRGVFLVESGEGGSSPVVLLEDDSGKKIIPIFVGLSEAISIQNALRGETSPRPMTHDLFISALECLGASVSGVLIDELDGGVYYARLTIRHEDLDKEVDARPSDCLALAIRAGAPVLIREEVVRSSAVEKGDVEGLRSLESLMD
ncbi:MAG: hypothetical protein A4E45_00176 [Methanosaeta sp. PtaB.Bin039]|nr:MAG: hypothetical protein A4E45_00176 [Methanosaeta sp. PtaB.Bin039]OPY45200.1 MAG: hypothetical protein A4E47_01054 [Methanosaeta sp. PtaU1.Bin028]